MYGSEHEVKIYTVDDGPIYRGGDKLYLSDRDLRAAVDKNGFMKRKGVSVNLNKKDKWVVHHGDNNGGITELDFSTVPDDLEILHTSGTHYEIVPKIEGTMHVDTYNDLLSKIVLKPI